MRPASACKNAEQSWTKIVKGCKSASPLKKKLRFAKTAETFLTPIGKKCTLEPCQACAGEENYRHDPRPPSPRDSEAAALQEALDLRRELEDDEAPTEDF